MQKKSKKQHWSRQRYSLVLRNVDNLQERIPFKGTGRQFAISLTALVMVIAVLGGLFSLTLSTIWQRYHAIEGHLRRDIAVLGYVTDSLQVELLHHQHYLRGLRAVFGDDVEYLAQAVPPNQRTDSTNHLSTLIQTLENPNSSSVRSPNTSKEVLKSTTSTPLSTLLTTHHFQSPLSRYYISDHYAPKEAHYGIDLLAPISTTVHSMAPGIVLLASWTKDSGYVIALQHVHGFISMYKHNAKLLKKVGDRVQAGAVIAIVGNTGELSTGPHLHFEIWKEGQSINPELLIQFH